MSAAPAPPPDGGLAREIDADGFAAATGASAEEVRRLEALRRLLGHWNAHMNLVSAASLDHFWARHALDSAQLIDLAPRARTWIDIGAGAGFPGLVLAILLKKTPGAVVHLVESQAKKCRFLAAATAALEAPARVHHLRAEDLKLEAEVVTARAVAPLAKLLAFARPAMERGAAALFLKGAGVEAELAEARRSWRFSAELIQSRSDPSGRIVRIEGLARA